MAALPYEGRAPTDHTDEPTDPTTLIAEAGGSAARIPADAAAKSHADHAGRHDRRSVPDRGWDEEPLVEGMSDEHVWLLIRRFNKIIHHVKDSHRLRPGGLDLVFAPEQDFSPLKMRAQLERVYMSVAYFVLWALDQLLLGALLASMVLILSEKFRRIVFPPTPIPLVDSLSGGLTKPKSGVLGSQDSLTGAPENFRGEAVEIEAKNFVTALAGIGTRIMSGVDTSGAPNPPDQGLDGPIPTDLDQLATMLAAGKDNAEGVGQPSQDKSKTPMERMVWSYVKPTMHVMNVVCEYAEKMSNALESKPPFGPQTHRLRLVAALALLAVLSVSLTGDFVVRSTSFALGVLLFGRPFLSRTSAWLDAGCPGWAKHLSINSVLFHGVPTNPQLALALLRYAERKRMPLPSPPRDKAGPSHVPLSLSDHMSAAPGDRPLGASSHEMAAAVAPDQEMLDEAGSDDVEATKDGSSKEPHRFLRFIKGTARAGIKTAIAIDKTRAKLTHSHNAQQRLGIIPSKSKSPCLFLSHFPARHHGEKGTLHLEVSDDHNDTTTELSTPTLTFTMMTTTVNKKKTAWTVPVSHITELRKFSAYGLKRKLTTSWALEQEVNDECLGIVSRDGGGAEWVFTAIEGRDVLFNRIIAVGLESGTETQTQTQAERRWEVW